MNRAIARQPSPIVVTGEPGCHAGGRGFESRRSRSLLSSATDDAREPQPDAGPPRSWPDSGLNVSGVRGSGLL
jgi:hypothetical protein